LLQHPEELPNHAILKSLMSDLWALLTAKTISARRVFVQAMFAMKVLGRRQASLQLKPSSESLYANQILQVFSY
jgi:hypothetical protein